MNQREEIRTDECGLWRVNGAEMHLMRYLGEEKTVQLPEYCTGIDSHAFTRTDVEEVVLHPGIATVAPHAFSGCRKLKKVVLPDTLQRIEAFVFFACRRLETVVMPDTLRYIGDGAFAGCTALKKMDFPSGLKMIGGGAFQNSGLEEVKLEHLTILAGSAFRCCNRLKQASVRAEWIDQQAFLECEALESLRLESGVMSIGADAFSGCKSLREVRIPGSVYELGCRAFRNIPGLTVRIPENLRDFVEHYRSFDMMEPENVAFFEPDAKLCYYKEGEA